MSSREGSLTLDRGLALLQAIADAGGEAATISELATAIGASRPAVYRLLVPLEQRGLVWRDGSKVRLGVGVLRMAGKVLPQIRAASGPILRELADDVGATAHLTVVDGDQAHAIAVVEPAWTTFHVAYRAGTRHSISKGAAGKAITLRDSDKGWVSTVGELQEDASGVAAPVRGVPGLRASVGIVTLGSLEVSSVGPKVVIAAASLADVLRS